MLAIDKIKDLPIRIKITGSIFVLLFLFLSTFLIVNNSVVKNQLNSINTLVMESLDSANQETGDDLVQSLDVTIENMNSLAMSGVNSLVNLLVLVSPEAIIKNEYLALTNYSKAATANQSVVFAIFIAKNGRPMSRYLDAKSQIVQRLLQSDGRNKIERIINGAKADNLVKVIEKPIAIEGSTLATLIVGIDLNYILSKSAVIEDLNKKLVEKNLTMANDLNGRVAAGFKAVSVKLIRFGLFANLLGLVIISVLMYLLAGVITKPLCKMVTVIRDINEGDGDLTKRIALDTADELGEMAGLFDAFLTNLHDMIVAIIKSTRILDSTATNIATSSEELATGSEEQQAQLSEIATTMEEMSSMILEASTHADATRSSAQITGSTADEGRNAVSKTVTGIEMVASTVAQASDQINELNKRSAEIGNVIQVIDDIADQTNLLALNANIEAARAGDAGRGFAVVADEVRKLAERTVTATGEISLMIESIQTDIQAAVDSMEEIEGHSTRGIDLAKESDKSLAEISSSVVQVISAVEQIATATSEQSSGAEEISKNIDGVSTVAKESANSAQGLANAGDELLNEAKALSELMAKFKVASTNS